MTESQKKLVAKINSVQETFEENAKQLRELQERANMIADQQKQLQGSFITLRELAEDEGITFDEDGSPKLAPKAAKKNTKE